MKTKLIIPILIGILSVYGILSWMMSQTNQWLLAGTLALGWLIFFIFALKKGVIKPIFSFKKLDELLPLLITVILLCWTNLTIERPLAFLTRPYTISIVPNVEHHPVDISEIKINNEQLALNSFDELSDWTYKETLSTSSTSPLTLPSITNESVTISLMKSKQAKSISIYRDDRLIKTVQLISPTVETIKVKVSSDHLLLLIPAYLGVFSAVYYVFQAILYYLRHKQNKVYQWIEKRLPKNLSSTELIYFSLPILFVVLFKWIGLANFSIRPILLLSLFIFMPIAQWLLSKKLKNHRAYGWCRVIFSLLYTSILLMIVMQIIYFFPNIDVTMTWIANHISIILLASTIILSFSVVLFSLFNHVTLAISLSSLFIFIIAIANYYKMLVVGEPIYPSDVSLITNIDEIIGYVKNLLSPALLMGLLIAILLLVILCIRTRKGLKLKRKLRVIFFVCSLTYLVSIFYYENSPLKFLVNQTVYFTKWNQLNNYQENGFLFGFITNLQNDLMVKNDYYTEHNMNEIINYYTKKAEEYNKTTDEALLPNIITIVSESLSDPTVFNQLSFSEDPLPNLRQYMQTYSSGKFLSPFKGNRTANVEFEYLVGFTNSLLLEGTIPFQQALSNKTEIPSIISYFNHLGYDSVAIHPNNAAFYKRSQVYPALGFHEFISIDEMKNLEYIASGKYVSDQAVFNELYLELEEATQPIFAYGLTMANHIAIFDNKFGETTIDVLNANGEHDTEMETYAEGLKQTDVALKDFITKIENYDEPTIVIFFGDHLINLQSNVHEEHGYIEQDTDANRTKMFFETPLLIMSNMDNFKIENIEDISPIFIAPLILKTLNLPLSPFYLFLLEVYNEFSVLHNNFILDENQNQLTELTTYQQQLLLILELIQYDILEGKEYTLDANFFNTAK